MKNIQISEHLFMLLVGYHICDDDENSDEISELIEAKMESIINRNLYTKYKAAPTKDEREKARNKYLDRKGYHKDFRW